MRGQKEAWVLFLSTTTTKILGCAIYGLKTFKGKGLASELHHILNEQPGTAITQNKNKQTSVFTGASVHSVVYLVHFLMITV